MSQDQATQLLCPQCGASNQSGAKFCIKCGTKLKQFEIALSIEERIEKLQGHIDEMLANLKSYSFQEIKNIMLFALKQNESYPSVQEVRELANANSNSIDSNSANSNSADSNSNDAMSELQRQYLVYKLVLLINYLDSFNEEKLVATLSDYEALKISKVGQISWIDLMHQYNDLCGQLKSMDQFDADNDSIDFSDLFQGPLEELCKDAKAAGQRIIENVGIELSDVNSNSIEQINFLTMLKESLNTIFQRVAQPQPQPQP